MARKGSFYQAIGFSGARDFSQYMRSIGFTRQWRYKRDRKAWDREAVEQADLRWCIQCGRDLHEDAKLSAMYCSPSCRENARRKRRRRGVYPGYMCKGPLLLGDRLDIRELAFRRHDAFYLCHGKTIEHAPKVCKRWRDPAVDDGASEDF